MALRVPLTRLLFDEAAQQALSRVLASGWIAQGEKVAHFEEEFAAYVGAKHAVAVSSGTMALHLSLLALCLPDGSEVICPSHSFVATANAIRMAGLTPRFVDVDRRTYNVQGQGIEEAIGSHTGALLPVHQLGLPCPMDDICRIAEDKGIPIIEDAACGLGSFYGKRMAGTFGRGGCFSFHPRKVLTTGEGGMVVTDDGAFAQKVRALRNHGIDAEEPQKGSLFPGLNGRMTDLQAELGLWGLSRVNAWIERRRHIAAFYTKAFGELPGLFLPRDVAPARHNFQSYCLAIAESCPLTRNALAESLAKAGISTRKGIPCIHRQPAYEKQGKILGLPNTEWLEEASLFLPIFPGMSEEEIQTVTRAVARPFGEVT